ncbi:MAG: TMEM165/GDT1 family protein [Pyrinomonadaceae bacterium]
MFSLFLVAYTMVLLAELLGDKTLYAVSTLASRYHPVSIFCGITVAFMGKMLVAVLIGQAITELPGALVTGMSAGTFFLMALFIWLKKPKQQVEEREQQARWSKGVLISFAAIFFTEWGDIGQLTAATLAARYQHSFIIWLAATLAMVTKACWR